MNQVTESIAPPPNSLPSSIPFSFVRIDLLSFMAACSLLLLAGFVLTVPLYVWGLREKLDMASGCVLGRPRCVIAE